MKKEKLVNRLSQRDKEFAKLCLRTWYCVITGIMLVKFWVIGGLMVFPIIIYLTERQ